MKKLQPRLKKTFFIIGITLVLGLVLFVLEKTKITNFYERRVDTVKEEAQTTSTAPSAQADFTDGGNREPGYSLREDSGTGGIVDNNGTFGSDVDTSKPITSSSREITLYSFGSGVVVASGKAIAGTSTLSNVSYRLIDNLSGVISTGELKVIDGKFSGVLNFTTNGTEGRLDIYGTEPDGTEFSNIEVPLRFR